MPTAAYAEFGFNRDAPVKSGHGVGTNFAIRFAAVVLGEPIARPKLAALALVLSA
jgi:hypothetical protein